MSKVVLRDESYAIVGACFDVYNHLGCGFLEAVYQEALAIEFTARSIPFLEQAPVAVRYKTTVLSQAYRADFLCYNKILIELKATSQLGDEHRAQTLNYLHATGLPLAILINFGHKSDLQHERFLPRV